MFLLALLLLAAPGTSRAANLFVANADNNTIEEFNSSGVGTVFASSGLDIPTGLAFDSAGNLYVANWGNNTIEKFRWTGGGLNPVGTVFASSGLSGPQYLAFDSAGNLYVSNTHNSDTIEKFNSSGVDLGAFGSNPLINLPWGLAFDSSDNLYVANFNNTIAKFNTNGVGSYFVNDINGTSGLYQPNDLAFDSAGNLYLSSPGKIQKFNSSGGVLNSTVTLFANSGLNYPYGLAFDSAGNLYVANLYGPIEEFSSSGVDLGAFANSGLASPEGLAFETIPEPSTSAMVALGIGTLVGGLRLRRRSS